MYKVELRNYLKTWRSAQPVIPAPNSSFPRRRESMGSGSGIGKSARLIGFEIISYNPISYNPYRGDVTWCNEGFLTLQLYY